MIRCQVCGCKVESLLTLYVVPTPSRVWRMCSDCATWTGTQIERLALEHAQRDATTINKQRGKG